MKIALISDTHGATKRIEIPACDLLIHAGDVCPDAWGRKWMRYNPQLPLEWMKDAWLPWVKPMLDDGYVKHVVFTWGNHDWTELLNPTTEFDFLPENVHLCVDSAVTIEGMKIWCSPWSNEFNGWSWMKEPDDLRLIYDLIPNDVDILVSHQPPYGSLGQLEDEIIGSRELLDTVKRVQPKLVVCGHIHSGYGEAFTDGVRMLNVACTNERQTPIRDATLVEWGGERWVR